MNVAAAAASAIDMPTTAATPAFAGGPAVAMGQGEDR